MKTCFILMACAAGLLQVHAQDEISLPDLVEGAKQWAQENLDTNVLNALPDLDREKTDKLLHDLQQEFQGEYIIDLAALRQPAEAIVPILESHPATQPYAAWLKPRLDYLQVADELRILLPPPAAESNQPPPALVNPPAKQVREIWVKKVSGRDQPTAALEYVPQLKPIFTEEKIPPELVWLAEVESSFDARARSPSGAAGLFQLMPDTAKRFGLTLWPRDQRYQPEPSGRASAQYLKALYDRFGDWRLALAAYNAGEGTVQRLLDRQKTKNYDDIAQHLPAETQLFVPKVEAILVRREGVKLAELNVPSKAEAPPQ
jgi:membrane-bound lytic murein transglycosylase D